MSGRPVVVRNVDRSAAEHVPALASAGVATVHEAAWRSGLLDVRMRPIFPGAAIAGTAVTALVTPGDNLMIHLAIEWCRPGDVLVVAASSPTTDGMIGELIATSLRAHGVPGVVMDTGVRDVAELRQMEFPIWARAVSAQGTVKASPGSVNVPVVCAGQRVCPGDVVVADDDGVVCIPAGVAGVVRRRAQQRLDKEAELRERLRAGELAADLNGLRDLALEIGVRYVDDLADEGEESLP